MKVLKVGTLNSVNKVQNEANKIVLKFLNVSEVVKIVRGIWWSFGIKYSCRNFE